MNPLGKKIMSLPLVNIYASHYEAWSKRQPTHNEMMQHYEKTGQMLTFINESLVARVTNAKEAAIHIGTVGADNGLGNFIDSTLDSNASYKIWRARMPSKTPKSLSKYQGEFPNYSPREVDLEINNIGESLCEGQILFHGGIWPGNNSDHFITQLPLSTSFCPQVALRNAEHKGKAYDANQIDLLVLRATSPITNVFTFRRAGTNLGHENEVLFASGANLTLRSRRLVRSNYPAERYSAPNKQIEMYVLEVDIS